MKWISSRDLLYSTVYACMLSCFSGVWLFVPHGLQRARLHCPWNSLGKNSGVGCHALLQGIFSTQGLNWDLPHWRWIHYCLSHQKSTRILEWVAYPFSRGSLDLGKKLGSPALQEGSWPSEPSGNLEVYIGAVPWKCVLPKNMYPKEQLA